MTKTTEKQTQETPRRVCFVSTFAYPLFNADCDETFGGAEVQMYLLATELAKDDDYDVRFITADFGQPPVEEHSGVTVHAGFSVDKTLMNYVRGPIDLYKTLRGINPDTVIQRTAAPETGICAFYSQNHDKRFVYSIAHDRNVDGSFASQGIYGTIYEYGFDRADHVVAQNQDQVELLNDWKNNHPETTVIKSGYPIRDKQPASNGYILWVGRSDTWKQPEKYIELAQAFPEEEFVMIMPKSSQHEFWETMATKAKNTENITFIESVPFEDIQEYFDEAKLFVNTSTAEGFPNTFIQSFKAQTPVLSLHVDPDNILSENEMGFTASGSMESLKNKFNVLNNDAETFETMCENCYQYVRENHDIKRIIENWKSIL